MASNQHVLIREAIPKDCEAICRLIQELANYEKMPNGPKINAETLKKHGFGPDKVFSCFVAVDTEKPTCGNSESSPGGPDATEQDGDGNIVGYAIYFFSFSTWEGLSVYMEDLYVRPSHRHRGLGGRLWRRVAQVAVQRGSNRLDWVVLGWNKGSLEMYKAKGAIDLTADQDWHLCRLTGDKLVEFAAQTDG